MTFSSHELIIIYHHGEPLSCVLPYERIYDAERLAGAGSTQHNRASERIDNVDVAVVHTLFPVEYHRDIH